MKAAIAKLIFQVHKNEQNVSGLEFDEQVIVLPGNNQSQLAEEAKSWARIYEEESNSDGTSDFRWEFIGIREIIPFKLENKALQICSGTLFMTEEEGFREYIQLKHSTIEVGSPLFL